MEMDDVTQQNAASTEKSAFVSEEMKAKAEEMKIEIFELMAMVSRSGYPNE